MRSWFHFKALKSVCRGKSPLAQEHQRFLCDLGGMSPVQIGFPGPKICGDRLVGAIRIFYNPEFVFKPVKMPAIVRERPPASVLDCSLFRQVGGCLYSRSRSRIAADCPFQNHTLLAGKCWSGLLKCKAGPTCGARWMLLHPGSSTPFHVGG